MTLQSLLTEVVNKINANKQEIDVCVSDVDTLQFFVDNIYNSIYPIGSIYMTTNTTSPAQLFGGTWEKIEDKFLLGASDTVLVNSTGGEANHKLTLAEMPSHTHEPTDRLLNTDTYNDFEFQLIRNLDSESTARFSVAKGSDYWVMGSNPSATGSFGKDEVIISSNTAATGGSLAHNNIPPYMAVYIWKRLE